MVRGAPGHQVDLLDLVVEMAGALFEVGMGRDADQGERHLLTAQILGQAPELTGNVAARVGILDIIGANDRILTHSLPVPAWPQAVTAGETQASAGAAGGFVATDRFQGDGHQARPTAEPGQPGEGHVGGEGLEGEEVADRGIRIARMKPRAIRPQRPATE